MNLKMGEFQIFTNVISNRFLTARGTRKCLPFLSLRTLPVLSFYHFDLDLCCCKRDWFAVPQIRLEDLISHLDGVALGCECHATSLNAEYPLLE